MVPAFCEKRSGGAPKDCGALVCEGGAFEGIVSPSRMIAEVSPRHT